jgi:hypothetical protein
MPANEFEKQVQRQLDDFELNPSASVWKKVEEQIRKRKRRRVVVFFLLAALLTAGYFTYYSLHTNKTHSTVQNSPADNNQNQISTDNNKNNTTVQQKLADKPRVVEPGMATKDVVIKKGNRTTNDLQISSGIPPVSHNVKRPNSRSDNNSNITIDRKPVNPASPVSKGDPVQVGPEMIVITDKAATTRTKADELPKDNVIKSANPEIQKDRLSIAAKQPIAARQDSIKSGDMLPSANKEIQLAKRKYRIKWGIDFSAGVTSNQSQLFSLTKSADRLYANSSPAATSSGAPFVVPAGPSSIEPGPAFDLGVTAELQFSPRSRISAGLQYAYASNRIMKGGVVYTLLPVQNASNYAPTRAVDQVYHGSPQNNYTNSYHFISLPVEYHWQINKSKKLRIEWNAGLSLNYLLSTNALVFNSSYGGIYYQDKNAINKMHINIGTGISFRFQSKNGMEWAIGPEVYFDTRRLVNNNHDARQFLLFTGINAKLYFGHRKSNPMQRSLSK